MLTSIGFMAFSIPLISGSLGLSDTVSIDARVKTDIMHQEYCGLGLQEYINYLLMDTTRWNNFLSDNVDPIDPTKVTAVVDVCGEDITLTVTQQPPETDGDPFGDPLPSTPITGAYNQRDFQTFKTVSDNHPLGGDSITYTITIINRSSDPTPLTEIHDTLPAGFTYDCTAPTNQLTLPGLEPQDVFPNIPCPAGTDIVWEMPPTLSIDPGDVVTLTFAAFATPVPGTYCNETKVLPGNLKTRSGQTAIVDVVEPLAGLCAGEAVVVSQTMDYANLVSTDLATIPFTYTLGVGYTITVENIGTDDLDLTGFINLLPVGFSYFTTDPSGDITDAPFNLKYVPTLDRQQVTWKFDPPISIASGITKTLKFDVDAVNSQGVYWVDLLVDFEVGTFDEKVYTWPTAIVAIKDIYNVTATDADGNEIVIDLQVQVQGEDGLIASWNIK